MLKDMVKIDKRFENSINLYLDIDNRNKIDSYVYTRSSQNIMDYYLDNIDNDRNHATMLIGPYGKGKSHMLLVLLDKVRSMEHPYLPIIISGTGDDLNQAFLIGLTDALKRAGLKSLHLRAITAKPQGVSGSGNVIFPMRMTDSRQNFISLA